jgi:hypothetical protein
VKAICVKLGSVPARRAELLHGMQVSGSRPHAALNMAKSSDRFPLNSVFTSGRHAPIDIRSPTTRSGRRTRASRLPPITTDIARPVAVAGTGSFMASLMLAALGQVGERNPTSPD